MISEQKHGFMSQTLSQDAMFVLRVLIGKYRGGQTELQCVFVDLEKAFDMVPKEELPNLMRKSGVAGVACNLIFSVTAHSL